jgi:hypothetical protein
MANQLISLRCRYAGREIALEGGPESVAALGHLLQQGTRAHIALECSEDTASPYEGWLTDIALEPGSGMATIERSGKSLVFVGKFAELAQSFAFAAANPGNHLHIEPYEGHPFLDRDSMSMVIECRM